MEEFPELDQLVTCVQDLGQPIGKRTHAAFYLRTLATREAIDALSLGKTWADSRAERYSVVIVCFVTQRCETKTILACLDTSSLISWAKFKIRPLVVCCRRFLKMLPMI